MSDSGQMLEAMDTADGHQTIIHRQWADFAGFAWRQYVAKGRGAVVVDLLQALKKGSAWQIPSYYIEEGGELLEKRGGWPDEEIAGVIRDYDPEEDVVFIFVRLNGECFYYNVSDDLTPVEAAGRRGGERG